MDARTSAPRFYDVSRSLHNPTQQRVSSRRRSITKWWQEVARKKLQLVHKLFCMPWPMCSGEWMVFSWTRSAPLRKLNHVQPTLPPKGSLARSVALRSLWAPSQKSRIVLSLILPPAPLRTEWDSAFSNPYSGAMSGDKEGIFCTPSCFAV